MRRHKRAFAAVAAAVLALTVSGCAGGRVRGAQDTPQDTPRPDPSSAQSSPAASPGAPGNATFVYAPNLDVVTDWDPASSYSNEIIAMQNVYESLTVYNQRTGKAEPRLATSWTSSSDGRIWTFTLRDGAVFHTGRPVNAAAAKASIERTRKIGAGAAYIWGAVEGIEARDAKTLVFTLKYPSPLDLVASSGYAAYVYDIQATGNGDLKKWFEQGKDAGSGPYTIGSWRKGEETELTLKAFEGYWGGWDGPHYTKITYRVTPEPTTAARLLQRDEVSFVPRLSPQLFAEAARQGAQTSETASFQNLLTLFNTASGPLRDVRIRQALQKAIDYEGLIDALKGSARPTPGLVPLGLLGFTSGDLPKQDLPGAQELLAQAGYGPDLQELRLTLTYAQGDSDQRLLVTLLSSALKQLHVTLEATPLQWNAQWGRGKAKDPGKRQDIFVMYWYPDYADAYSWFVNVFRSADPISFNLSYLEDRAVDSAIDALPELTATDRAAAEKSYTELQRMIVTERAAVAVPYVQNYQRAYARSVRGYVDNPAYPNVVFVHGLAPGL
ncbi:ABC transporter substrate-binding protein [Streptosporangium sp. NPDC051023]|uniref:ABC transporter substrate-binding protein n=1 Tax=Streptosporangium sp. NPDC051023 TaxID=3155410 RepID=UPI00344DE27C